MFGPQKVGGRYHNGYWHYDYEVVAIDRKNCRITIKKDDGTVKSHMTDWDKHSDKQVGQPCNRIHCKWGR